MATLAEIRQQYPQYADMSDADLASALHRKFYSDMPREDFDKRMGVAAAPQKPVEDFAPENLLKPVTDIPGEIVSAAKSAGSAIIEHLNPFSESRQKAIEERGKGDSFIGDVAAQLKGLGSTGRGLAAIPELAVSPVTGAARSLIGHPYSAITGMPYDQAKDAVDKAMMGLRPSAATPKTVQTVPGRVPSADEIKSAATSAFDSARSSGVAVPASDVANVASTIKSDLFNRGLRQSITPQTHSVLDDLLKAPAGATADVADLHAMRQAFGHVAGMQGPEKAAASVAMKKLDDLLATVSPELKDAIGNYAASKRSDVVAGRMERGLDQAGAANSGMNAENAIRQQLKQILSNEKLQKGFTKAELTAMRSIVRGASPANIMRALGNITGGGGGLMSFIAAAGGGVLAGPIGIGLPVVGAGIKAVSNAMTQRKVGALDEMIRARSPLAQSIPATQAPMPSPLLSTIFPGQLPQGLPLPLGLIPTRAQDEQSPR